jgi:hypothetical protein
MNFEAIAQEVPKSYIPIFIEMIEIDTMQELVQYRSKKSKEDKMRVDTLMQLIQLEAINEEVEMMTSYPDVENIFKKITKTG